MYLFKYKVVQSLLRCSVCPICFFLKCCFKSLIEENIAPPPISLNIYHFCCHKPPDGEQWVSCTLADKLEVLCI